MKTKKRKLTAHEERREEMLADIELVKAEILKAKKAKDKKQVQKLTSGLSKLESILNCLDLGLS